MDPKRQSIAHWLQQTVDQEDKDWITSQDKSLNALLDTSPSTEADVQQLIANVDAKNAFKLAHLKTKTSAHDLVKRDLKPFRTSVSTTSIHSVGVSGHVLASQRDLQTYYDKLFTSLPTGVWNPARDRRERYTKRLTLPIKSPVPTASQLIMDDKKSSPSNSEASFKMRDDEGKKKPSRLSFSAVERPKRWIRKHVLSLSGIKPPDLEVDAYKQKEETLSEEEDEPPVEVVPIKEQMMGYPPALSVSSGMSSVDEIVDVHPILHQQRATPNSVILPRRQQMMWQRTASSEDGKDRRSMGIQYTLDQWMKQETEMDTRALSRVPTWETTTTTKSKSKKRITRKLTHLGNELYELIVVPLSTREHKVEVALVESLVEKCNQQLALCESYLERYRAEQAQTALMSQDDNTQTDLLRQAITQLDDINQQCAQTTSATQPLQTDHLATLADNTERITHISTELENTLQQLKRIENGYQLATNSDNNLVMEFVYVIIQAMLFVSIPIVWVVLFLGLALQRLLSLPRQLWHRFTTK